MGRTNHAGPLGLPLKNILRDPPLLETILEFDLPVWQPPMWGFLDV